MKLEDIKAMALIGFVLFVVTVASCFYSPITRAGYVMHQPDRHFVGRYGRAAMARSFVLTQEFKALTKAHNSFSMPRMLNWRLQSAARLVGPRHRKVYPGPHWDGQPLNAKACGCLNVRGNSNG